MGGGGGAGSGVLILFLYVIMDLWFSGKIHSNVKQRWMQGKRLLTAWDSQRHIHDHMGVVSEAVSDFQETRK